MLYVQDTRQDHQILTLLSLAQTHGIPSQRVTRRFLDTLLGQSQVHQGVVAACVLPKEGISLERIVERHQKQLLLMILDGIQDPHNLGACFRNAEAFGVHAIISPKDRAVGLTPTVKKIACGAAEVIPFIQVTNLARVLDWLKQQGVWVIGTDSMADTPLSAISITFPLALVMGNEQHGMRQLTKKKCDFVVRIPMQGHINSLNISVASGICLYEIIRQTGDIKNS